MLSTAANNHNDLNLDKALKRMRTHAKNTKSSFARSLKVKAPDTYGRLSGPSKTQA